MESSAASDWKRRSRRTPLIAAVNLGNCIIVVCSSQTNIDLDTDEDVPFTAANMRLMLSGFILFNFCVIVSLTVSCGSRQLLSERNLIKVQTMAVPRKLRLVVAYMLVIRSIALVSRSHSLTPTSRSYNKLITKLLRTAVVCCPTETQSKVEVAFTGASQRTSGCAATIHEPLSLCV